MRIFLRIWRLQNDAKLVKFGLGLDPADVFLFIISDLSKLKSLDYAPALYSFRSPEKSGSITTFGGCVQLLDRKFVEHEIVTTIGFTIL